MYFTSCFNSASVTVQSLSAIESFFKNILLIISASYYWYLVTEGQITPLFLVTLIFMQATFVYNKFVKNERIDENGKFLLNTFQVTFLFVAAWSYFFWKDEQLRKKYPGILYVPEPWSVYSLHYKQYWNLFSN
jgi:ceroid-lipofuscinosis protein 6